MLPEHLLEKKKKAKLKEVKESFPGFSFLLYYVIALFSRAYSAIMKSVTVDYFKVTLYEILSLSFF